jgi:hypothetical protein
LTEDHEAGGFFPTSADHEELLAREKPADDGAEPSGNSVHALNLLRLSEPSSDDRYRQRADATIEAFAGILERAPAALSEMLLALDYRLDTPKEIVIVTPGSRDEAEPFLAPLRASFVPNRILAILKESEVAGQAELVPLVAASWHGRPRTSARGECLRPTSDPAVFAKQLRNTAPGATGGFGLTLSAVGCGV